MRQRLQVRRSIKRGPGEETCRGFFSKRARVDYDVTLAADGSLSSNLLRDGSGSPITGSRLP